MTDSGATIFRYTVPVGEQVAITLTGDPIAAGCRAGDAAEFWAIHDPLGTSMLRYFMVVGTGYQLPAAFKAYWGTVVAPGGEMVWHLVEVA